MVFIDGENLTMRYQKMLEEGLTPNKNNIHQKDVYAWNPSVISVIPFLEVLRATYYTYAVGSDEKLQQWANELKQSQYTYRGDKSDFAIGGFLNPRIFKKPQQQAKRKGVDISIAVDSLTLAQNNSLDVVFLVTGDVDYLPLIEAIMKMGKRVYLAALSSGLSDKLPNVVDRFECLDERFFTK
jgi:uncharacterized LabA/DUF88 family protein